MKEGYTTREIQAQTQMDIISGYYRKIGLTPGITIEDILQMLEADLQYIRESNTLIEVDKIINSASIPSSSITGEENQTAFVPCDEHDEGASGFFHSLDGRHLGYVREVSIPVAGESEAIAVLDWLLEFESTEGGFPDKIIICDGDYYWESDNDGDQPLDGKGIMKIYKQSKK